MGRSQAREFPYKPVFGPVGVFKHFAGQTDDGTGEVLTRLTVIWISS